MFLLIIVLPQRPKETWTGNTTTKRNMDRQYNDQEKHGQTIQRPKETWTGNTKTKRNRSLYCLSFGISFGHCIVCHSVFLLVIVLSVIRYFFWSLYCLSFGISIGHCIVCHSVFLLVIVLSVIRYFCSIYWTPSIVQWQVPFQ
jgi:hypothetical protein